ncbi:MAG TPA: AAA family ATPase [Methanoregulaceae archaeon]|nr:AAA family ATPase [Methanoregulaceae archaeon]
MRITVSGPPGSGTTTLARWLAARTGFALISAGEVFRGLARERGMDLAAFGALAESDPAFDRMIDERQREIAEQTDDIVVEGRLSGRMVSNADLRIWLQAPLPVRVRRILEREAGADIAGAEAETAEREACEARRYRQYYGIEIDDLSVYDLVLNTERFDVETLGAIVMTAFAAVQH